MYFFTLQRFGPSSEDLKKMYTFYHISFHENLYILSVDPALIKNYLDRFQNRYYSFRFFLLSFLRLYNYILQFQGNISPPPLHCGG